MPKHTQTIRIVWVCLTILWGWHLKVKIFHNYNEKGGYVIIYLNGKTDASLPGHDFNNNIMFTLPKIPTSKKQVITETLEATLKKPSGLNQELN